MRVGFFYGNRQVFVLIIFCILSCTKNPEEIPVIPPPTSPMVRDYIGYGVINVSFTHVLTEPQIDNTSLGYLRKKSIVKVIERRSLSNRGNAETWVRIDTDYSGVPEGRIKGWLKENCLNIYNSEAQAQTAAEIMPP